LPAAISVRMLALMVLLDEPGLRGTGLLRFW
jgi:hypothetical protein